MGDFYIGVGRPVRLIKTSVHHCQAIQHATQCCSSSFALRASQCSSKDHLQARCGELESWEIMLASRLSPRSWIPSRRLLKLMVGKHKNLKMEDTKKNQVCK